MSSCALFLRAGYDTILRCLIDLRLKIRPTGLIAIREKRLVEGRSKSSRSSTVAASFQAEFSLPEFLLDAFRNSPWQGKPFLGLGIEAD